MNAEDIMRSIAGSIEDRWRTAPGKNGHFHFYTPGKSFRTTVEKGHSHTVNEDGSIGEAHAHGHDKGQPA